MRLNQILVPLLLAILVMPGYGQLTAEEWVVRGIGLVTEGKYAEAIQSFNEAIWIDPEFAPAWTGKGDALYDQGRYAGAATATRVENGKITYRKGNFADSIQAYDEAIRLDPEYAAAWNGKGKALIRYGTIEQALACFDEAIRLDPDFVEAWYNKGKALSSLGNDTGAVMAYDEAIRLDPEFAPAWCNKGNALKNQGRYAAALVAYDEAINLWPKYIDAWFGKNYALDGLGRTSEAEAAWLVAYVWRETVDPFIGYLDDEDWQTRQKAAEALGEIGNEKAIEPLRNQAVNDENEDVRQTATRALERIRAK